MVAPGENYCEAAKCKNDGQEKQDIAGRHGIPPFFIEATCRHESINVFDVSQFVVNFRIDRGRVARSCAKATDP
jgi:hypothetical protein